MQHMLTASFVVLMLGFTPRMVAGAGVAQLEDTVRSSDDLSAQGEAIIALSRIPSPAAEAALVRLTASDDLPPLVRTWAAAGQIQQAQSVSELLALKPLVEQYPAVQRPMQQRLAQLPAGALSAEDALQLVADDPKLQAVLAPALTGLGGAALAEQMMQHPDDDARRLAAGLLASAAQSDPAVMDAIAARYAFTSRAREVPWGGGALYVPSAPYSQAQASAIVEGLVAWSVFCQRTGDSDSLSQIYANARSIELLRRAGMSRSLSSAPDGLLLAWGQAHGVESVRAILRAQGLEGSPQYKPLLDRLEQSP